MSGAMKHTDVLDDWKNEFLPHLQKSYIYSSLEEDCKVVDKEVTVLIEHAVAFSIKRTKTIIM